MTSRCIPAFHSSVSFLISACNAARRSFCSGVGSYFFLRRVVVVMVLSFRFYRSFPGLGKRLDLSLTYQYYTRKVPDLSRSKPSLQADLYPFLGTSKNAETCVSLNNKVPIY